MGKYYLCFLRSFQKLQDRLVFSVSSKYLKTLATIQEKVREFFS